MLSRSNGVYSVVLLHLPVLPKALRNAETLNPRRSLNSHRTGLQGAQPKVVVRLRRELVLAQVEEEDHLTKQSEAGIGHSSPALLYLLTSSLSWTCFFLSLAGQFLSTDEALVVQVHLAHVPGKLLM